MRHRVTLLAADGARVAFETEPGHSVVKAAARAGYDLTRGCLQGRCTICRARLVSGTVAAIRRPSPNAIGDPVHRADGCVLLCSVGATSDLVVAPLSPWSSRAPASAPQS